jgi:tetratricopeptide (TPR) repeat protein
MAAKRLPLMVVPAMPETSCSSRKGRMDMSYAKTSLRAEQRSLREKTRALGMSHRQIAVEFARRYGLRSRAAWRHAYGWSQTEAAEQINSYAAHAGVSPDGATVTMTGPHLCECENWPGEGPEPAGRRPTPYLLSLLAGVYGCTVHDLLDMADYEHMPPADRLIVGKSPSADGQHSHGGQSIAGITQAGIAPRAKTAARLAPLTHAAGRSAASGQAVGSTTDVAELTHLRDTEPGSRPALRHGVSAGLPASAAFDRLSERALIQAAAHESSAHAEWAEGSNVGEATLEQLDADVRRIAADYVHAPPLPMFAEMLRVRDRIYFLLAGRQKPAATAHLHLLAGVLCGLLANASTDLGYRDAAAEQARAAWAYGDIIGHNGLRAWTRGMQALIEYWSGRPQHAVRLAQSARRYADSVTAEVRLHSIEGRAWSLLGDAREASRCLCAAAKARESSKSDDYLHDEVGGVFGFADTKNHCYAGAAFIHLGQADPALEATSRAVELYAGGPAEQRSYGAESLARVDTAVAHLLKQRLDGAADSLALVLAIPAGLRIAQLGDRLADVRARLAGTEFSGAREARGLRDQIDDFAGKTLAQELDRPGCAR